MLLYVEKVLSNPFAEYNFQNWTTLLGLTVSCTLCNVHHGRKSLYSQISPLRGKPSVN